MAISQQQIVDYLNKKLGYGVAKTDTVTSKSPSNEANASPLLSVGSSIWQLSNLIPTTIPATNNSIVAVYADSLSTTVQCTVDNTTSVVGSTWLTNLTDWIPPSFGSTYQVKVYAAPAGSISPQTLGTQLFVDGSGNEDSWFFDYQAGILNFADTNIPSATAGKVIYIVGARYIGQKGISSFPLGLNLGNVLISGNAVIGNITTASGLFWSNGVSALNTYSNSNVISYLTGTVSVGNLSTSNGLFWANGINYSSTVPGLYSNANVASYLPIDSTIGNINSNISLLFSNAATQAGSLNTITANLGSTAANVNTLFSNAATQQNAINSLYTNANANTAAYLATGSVTNIVVTGNTTVTGTSSIGGNLTVLGNLIVQGNVYELQTEIITQNEIVAGSLFAGAYFYANGMPFNYGNVQVAAYLATNTDATISYLNANAAVQAILLNSISANTGAYYIYANANIGAITNNVSTLFSNAASQALALGVLDANLGVATNNITTLFANTVAQETSISGLRANITAANIVIANIVANISAINANLGWLTSNVNSINSNLGAYQIYANANLGTATTNISALQANVGAYEIYANANLGALSTGLSTLQANVGAYEIYANANIGTISINLAALTSNVGAYEIFANANTGAYQIFANANAVAQQAAINSLYSGANANTAAYLLKNTITIGGNSDATSANTGVLQVWGGASVGANLYVGGNLIVQGNSYVLNTEILTQNEVVAGNLYAGKFFWANGETFLSSSYSNANVASYLPTYSGNLNAGNAYVVGRLFAANIVTAGSYGNINGVNSIFANNFVFSSNGINIIDALLSNTLYSNIDLHANLKGNISIGNIITTRGLFWSNGVNALAPTYGNTQVGAFLPIYTGNITAGNVTVGNAYVGNATIGTISTTNITTSNVTVDTVTANTITANTITANTVTTGNITAANVNTGNIYAISVNTTANANVGNIIASQFFWANGVVFSSSNYGNANVAVYLATQSGNISANNVIASNNIYAKTFLGNVSSIGNVLVGNIITAGSGGSITGANVVSANTFVFSSNNLNILSSVPIYGNANVQMFMANFGINSISTTGNVTSGNINTGNIYATGNIASGNLLTNSLRYANGVPFQFGSTYSNANVQSYLAAFGSNTILTTGNVTAGNLLATGNASINGNLTVYGTINVANITVTNTEIVYVTEQVQGNAIVTGNTRTANLLTDGLRYANGNPYQFGSTYSNANVASYLPVYGGNILAGNVFASNISISSNLTVANATIQNLTTAGSYGNISGANFIFANSFVFNSNGVNILSAFAAMSSVYGDANVALYLPTYTGNVSAGNILTNGIRYANGVPYVFGSTYSNTNVAAYLTTDSTISGIQANIGAYHIYANANIGTLTVNAATQATSINNINSNVGAYQIYANANATTQATSINAINANLGAYETWANATFLTSSYSNIDAGAYLANGTGTIVVATGAQASAANTGAFRVWGGASIGANLFVGGNLIVQGNSYVLQTEILASNEVVSNSIYAGAYFYANGTPFNYGNVQVSAFLAANTDATISNLRANAAVQAILLNNLNSNVGAYQIYANANATTQATSINDINANVGAYETWANATFAFAVGPTTLDLAANLGAYQIYANANLGTLFNSINSSNANVGAYQIYANANIGTLTVNAGIQATSINATNANVGAYQIYANANIGTIIGNINSINANLGAYQIYANANIGTIIGNINSINANLGAYQIYANANAVAQAAAIDSLYTNANANTAAYLPTYFGNIGANLTSTSAPIAIQSGSSTWKFKTDGRLYAPSSALFDGALTINTGSDTGEHDDLFIGGDTGWVTGESHGVNWFFGSKLEPTTLARMDTYYSGSTASMRWKNLYYGGTTTSTVMTLTATGSATADLEIRGNAKSSILLTDSILYSNGVPYVFGTTYANANVAAYLTTYTGNLQAGNIVTTGGVFWANGAPYGPAMSIGDQNLTTDGVTKVFTLTQYSDTNSVIVSINGVIQAPTYAYTVSGDQITFNEAPLSTDLVDIRFLASAFITLSDYSNSNVTAYLTTATGNISAGNVTATGVTTSKGIINNNPPIISGATTLSSAFLGGLLELSGSSPYTVTLPDPTQYTGAMIAIWQNTAQNITLSTPSGNFYGPNGSSTSTKVLAQATTQYWHLWADGYNWSVFAIQTV